MSKAKESNLEKMQQVLGDTFVLYMKTYAVHWNYTGTNFFSVHKMTEGQYQELAEAVDLIAERIRAMGHEAPISLSSILNSADLNEIKKENISAGVMLEELVKGNELLSKRAKEAAKVCEENEDPFGHDMMAARVGAHDKAHWMLKSLLKS